MTRGRVSLRFESKDVDSAVFRSAGDTIRCAIDPHSPELILAEG